MEPEFLLEYLSPTLVKAIVSMDVTGIKAGKDLVNALNTSMRNVQRIISFLETIKVVKLIRYGRRKIIVSIIIVSIDALQEKL